MSDDTELRRQFKILIEAESIRKINCDKACRQKYFRSNSRLSDKCHETSEDLVECIESQMRDVNARIQIVNHSMIKLIRTHEALEEDHRQILERLIKFIKIVSITIVSFVGSIVIMCFMHLVLGP